MQATLLRATPLHDILVASYGLSCDGVAHPMLMGIIDQYGLRRLVQYICTVIGVAKNELPLRDDPNISDAELPNLWFTKT